MKRKTYYIESEGSNPDAVKGSLSWLLNTCNNTGTNEAIIAFVDKSNIVDILTSITGKTFTNNLIKNNETQVKWFRIKLLTEKLKHINCNGPALLVYPNKKILNAIDDLKGITEVLVIPWHLAEVDKWVKTWSAIALDDNLEEVIKDNTITTSPIVEAAIRRV